MEKRPHLLKQIVCHGMNIGQQRFAHSASMPRQIQGSDEEITSHVFGNVPEYISTAAGIGENDQSLF
jgi:hypothetical protein